MLLCEADKQLSKITVDTPRTATRNTPVIRDGDDVYFRFGEEHWLVCYIVDMILESVAMKEGKSFNWKKQYYKQLILETSHLCHVTLSIKTSATCTHLMYHYTIFPGCR